MTTIAAEDHSASAAKAQDDRNPVVTKKGRRWQVTKIFVISALTILSISFVIYDVVMTAKQVKRQKELQEHITTSLKVSSLINSVQIERTYVTFHLVLSSKPNISNLTELRIGNTIVRLKDLGPQKSKLTFPGQNGTVIRDIKPFINEIYHLRSEVRNETDYKRARVEYYFTNYTSLISQLISWLVKDTRNLDDPNGLAAFYMIVKSREEFEMEKALGAGFYFYKGNVILRNKIFQRRIRGEAFLETSRLLSQALNDNYYLFFEKDINTCVWLSQLKTKRQQIATALNITQPMEGTVEWFKLMKNYTDLLIRLEVNEADRVSRNIEKIIKEDIILLSLHCLLVFSVFIIFPVFIISLVRAQSEFYRYAHSLHHKVDLEQSRTEFLLAENARHMEGE